MQSYLHPWVRAFDSTAELYQTARLEYPPDSAAFLGDVLRLSASSLALDLGAGTGKLTKALEGSGARFMAVEPLPGMRRVCRAQMPDLPIVAGVAEAIPLCTASFDAVVVGQAIHWFDAPAAILEIHRVLKPGGRLGMVWLCDVSVSWIIERNRVIEPYADHGPRKDGVGWRQAFQESRLFTAIEQARFEYTPLRTREEVLGRTASTSFIAVLPEHLRREALDRLAQVLDTHPDTAGRPRFESPMVAEVYWCERLDSSAA